MYDEDIDRICLPDELPTLEQDMYHHLSMSKYDLTVCGDGTLIQILFFWTLSILVFYGTPSCFYIKNNVSETGFCLRLQVEPTQ
jgi:hypothetical protein